MRQPFSTGEAIALSSPSGRMSRRSRRAALKRLSLALFGPEGMPAPNLPEPNERERLLRTAAELEGLADRGMCPRRYRKDAARLREQAEKLG